MKAARNRYTLDVTVETLKGTYREQIEGKYWFTTYARADEYLHFPTGGVHIREVIKYSNYKAPASK